MTIKMFVSKKSKYTPDNEVIKKVTDLVNKFKDVKELADKFNEMKAVCISYSDADENMSNDDVVEKYINAFHKSKQNSNDIRLDDLEGIFHGCSKNYDFMTIHKIRNEYCFRICKSSSDGHSTAVYEGKIRFKDYCKQNGINNEIIFVMNPTIDADFKIKNRKNRLGIISRKNDGIIITLLGIGIFMNKLI